MRSQFFNSSRTSLVVVVAMVLASQLSAQNYQGFETYGASLPALRNDCWASQGFSFIADVTMQGSYSLRSSPLSGSPVRLFSPWLQLDGSGVVTLKHRTTGTSSTPRLTVSVVEKETGIVTDIFVHFYSNTAIVSSSIPITFTGVYKILFTAGGAGGTGSSRIHIDDIYYPEPDIADRANNPGGTGNCATLGTPPTAVDDAATTDEDQTVVIDVLNNDTDPENDIDPSSLSIPTAPTNGVAIVNASNEIEYSPAADFDGTDQFTYQICDLASQCSQAVVTITVNPVNDAPVGNDDLVTIDEDAPPIIVNVLSNDTDVDDAIETLTLVSVSQPVEGGSASIVGNSIEFTTAPNFNGTVTFSYTLRDPGGLTAVAQVIVTVNPVNDPPVAVGDGPIVMTPDQTSVTIQVLANDTDPDNLTSELIVISVTGPNFGSVSIVDNQVVYSRTSSIAATEVLTYTIEDPLGLQSQATITILLPEITLIVSEGFSPNDDGNNDNWYIQGIENYPDNSVRVFNRWGMLVYETRGYSNLSNFWNGRANAGQQSGQSLSQGTYYFILLTGEGRPSMEGYVLINK